MNRSLLVLTVLLVGLAFAGTGFVQAVAKPAIHEITGQVVNVGAGAKTLAVKGPKGDVNFDMAAAKVTGYKATDEIKTGDKVIVKYDEKDGKMVATQISKVVPKTTAKKK